jgi:HlyD family secretion protein
MGIQNQVKTGLGPRERIIGLASVATLVVLFALFHFISISSAVVASGRVVVQGNPRPVQSLEGGLVDEIKVENGDTVAAGEVLVRLDPTLLTISRDIVRGRLAELIARRSRLEAEEQQLDDVLPPDVPPQLEAQALVRHLAGQREIFNSRRSVLASRKAQLTERILQYEAQILGTEAQIEATESQIALVTREVTNLQILHDQGLAPERRLLELRGREAGLLGQIAQYRSELAGARNAIRDSELKIVQAEQEFHEQIVTTLREVTAKIDENTLEYARVTETLARLEIRAPVGGVVHEMQVWAGGGVVPPKETILTIIPVSGGLEFELQVPPESIDTVFVSQEARVRFPAFNQRSTPELTGVISSISPDSVTDRTTGQAFYRVKVSIPQDELIRLGSSELIPGMPVEAFLQTGERSILSFLIKPLVDQINHTFRES